MMLYATQRHVLCFLLSRNPQSLILFLSVASIPGSGMLHIDVISTVMTTVYSVSGLPYLAPEISIDGSGQLSRAILY